MAEEKDEAAEAPPKPKISIGVILALLSTLATLGALGLMAYSKLIFKRPAITEKTEIAQKKVDAVQPPKELKPKEKVIVGFDQMLVNIASVPGRNSYATLAFSVECRDQYASQVVDVKKAKLLDAVIGALGKKSYAELNTIQGKLILKTELIREFNQIAGPLTITDLFFSTFTLQY